MRHFLALLFAVVLFAVPLRAFEIAGEIISEDAFPPAAVFAIPTTFDTFYVTIEGLFNSRYSFELDSGSYYLAAYQDINLNLTPDLGDPFGFWGEGQLPSALLVEQDHDTIDIELSTTNQAGFSGEISYDGDSAGATLVVVSENPDFTGLPSGAGILFDLTGDSDTGNGPYTALCDSAGSYYAFAYMDVNGNIQYDNDEPMGVYGGDTPQVIEVVIGDLPTDIDIVLQDAEPFTVRPRIGTLPEGYALGVPYPNPFNATTSIPIQLPESSHVQLHMYDLLGRETGEIFDARLPAGSHSIPLSADGYSSGVYFVELKANGFRSQQRLVLVK